MKSLMYSFNYYLGKYAEVIMRLFSFLASAFLPGLFAHQSDSTAPTIHNIICPTLMGTNVSNLIRYLHGTLSRDLDPTIHRLNM